VRTHNFQNVAFCEYQRKLNLKTTLDFVSLKKTIKNCAVSKSRLYTIFPTCSLTLTHPPAGELVCEGAGRAPSPALIKQSRQDLHRSTKQHHFVY